MHTTIEFRIRPIADKDFFPWHALYEGYCEFYERELDDEKALRVWGWLTGAERHAEAIVAQNEEGELIGLAHFRNFVRPLAGSTGLHLDDLFVASDARDHGVGTALIEHVHSIAVERKASLVRWITANENETAQRVYDRLATKTEWVTYDLAV